MNALIAVIIFLSASFASASVQCLQSPFGSNNNRLLVAFNNETGKFNDISATNFYDQFFMNNLVDPSCIRIEVLPNRAVRCHAQDGTVVPVGILQKPVGNYGDWVFYGVAWNDKIIVKSTYSSSTCNYGIAVQ